MAASTLDGRLILVLSPFFADDIFIRAAGPILMA
jgi:hypothetical protein